MDRPADDTSLYERAAAGDSAAWEELLQRHHRRLLSFIGKLIPPDLQSLIEPQDVLSDTCFEAYQRFSEFSVRDDDSIFRWLATIARHRLIDTVRAHRRQKRGGLVKRFDTVGSDEEGAVIDLLHELAVYERTPSRSAMRHELRIVLETSIGRLDAPLREALRLRHVSGLPFKDVAVRMSRTERAVQQLCTRALRQLRTELQSKSYFI